MCPQAPTRASRPFYQPCSSALYIIPLGVAQWWRMDSRLPFQKDVEFKQLWTSIGTMNTHCIYPVPVDGTIKMCQGESNEKTAVNLRIEGKHDTVFEDIISTCGHRVTTKSGGTRHCNGTNNDNNRCPGATCTTALDDANKFAHFGFDGAYFEEFDDFFITTINNETSAGDDYWAICLNFAPAPVGGCQQKVKNDDEVLSAYATVNVTVYFLRLYGPKFATVGQPVVLTVTDGKGTPIQNAIVRC